MPSTKAAGGGIYSGVLLKDVKVLVKVRRTLSSVGTSSSNIYFKLASSKIKDDSSKVRRTRAKLWTAWTQSREWPRTRLWAWDRVHA